MMTPHEKAILTYKALQERKKKREQEANKYEAKKKANMKAIKYKTGELR